MLTLATVSLLASVLITYVVLRAARGLGVLANPTPRSSHVTPTPTLGGIGFVLVVLAFAAIHFDQEFARVVLVAGSMLAVMGLIDDLVHLSAAVRLVVQALVVTGALWVLQPAVLVLGGLTLVGPWLVLPLSVAGVWMVNLYNFMDGVDGIAGVQCVLFCGGALLLGADQGFTAQLLVVCGAAVAGFLLYNWAPARIFMGDVGSAFLGLLVWVVALWMADTEQLPFIASMLLLTWFWFDASYTLCVRIVTGQDFASAHRSHLYQRLAQRIGHGRTVVIVLVYGAVWLLPLAWLTMTRSDYLMLWLALACAPLLGASIRLRAGVLTEDRVGET